MAFQLNQDIDAVALTVKNTFISLQYPAPHAFPRRSSVPASSKLCRNNLGKIVESLHFGSVDSDVSTDAQTEFTCSECGVSTPASLDNFCFELEASPASKGWPEEVCTKNLWSMPPSALTPTVLTPTAHSPTALGLTHRLNTKASAFLPQATSEDPAKQIYKNRFVEVINCAKKKAMQHSDHIAHVELSDSGSGWCFIVQPRGSCDSEGLTERLITIAKEALLDAASKSKCIYLMGYSAPKPFVMQPQGFQATLGAMENAKSACWHVFKKGFCRHGADCSKQHAACELPVQVIVEATQLDSCPRFISAFKQEMSDLAMVVTATLEECTYADKVEAFKDKGSQGWTIEVMPKEELKTHKEYLLTLAKNAIFNATSRSNTAYIMGYAAKPFTSKSQGFVAILGDMQDESRACWDFYSKGICTRGCECRWEHPECLTPINVVVKERSSMKCSAAVREYLAGSGLLTYPCQ